MKVIPAVCVNVMMLRFYFTGEMPDLNAMHVINMVVEPVIPPYGQETDQGFLDLSALCPNTLIVSGLAYGIDIHAHRAAPQNHFKTIGVLAHGLTVFILPNIGRQPSACWNREVYWNLQAEPIPTGRIS